MFIRCFELVLYNTFIDELKKRYMCTNFSMKTKNDNHIIGRTMELGFSLNSELFFRSPGFYYTQEANKELIENNLEAFNENFKVNPRIKSTTTPLTWHGEYGFVAMNALGANIAADGMNTEGLTTGTMVLAQSKYQKLTYKVLHGENFIYYFNLSNWILSECASCQDVIDKLSVDELVLKNNKSLKMNKKEGIKVINPFTKVPNAMKFHFPVHDAEGNNIVLEYVNGELTISDLGPTNVLTNDPLIEWQQTNVINNYAGITPFNTQDSELADINEQVKNNFICKTAAQGTGFEGLPGSSTPVGRFVRAAMMTNFVYSPKNEEDGTTLAFHILNTVDIPYGTSRELPNIPNKDEIKIISDYTQWSTVSDLKNRVYSIRMYDSPQVFRVELDKLKLDDLPKFHKTLPIDQKSIDLTDEINKKE